MSTRAKRNSSKNYLQVGKARFLRSRIDLFALESNRIEGIHYVSEIDKNCHYALLTERRIDVSTLCRFATMIAGAKLRTQVGDDVIVGNYIPPPGGHTIRARLEEILEAAQSGDPSWDAWRTHCEFEKLHPFMDGNGRTGRALWAWKMIQDGYDPFQLSFLHTFYYQSLARYESQKATHVSA